MLGQTNLTMWQKVGSVPQLFPGESSAGPSEVAPPEQLKVAFDRRPLAGAEAASQDRTAGLGLDLAEQMRFFSRTYEELEVRFDPNTRSIWCYLRPRGSTCFTPSMIRELIALHRAIQGLVAAQPPQRQPLVHYYVQRSRVPGIYNTGGDLGFLIDRIGRGDREAVRSYAYGCVDAVFHIATGFDSGLVSVCLLEGDALGGGLEGALCCNYIIAERSVQLGLPEILFNCFPGMGAYSMLARRIGVAMAERMIFSGRIYSAEQMYEIGVVDLVVDDGAGEQAVRDYIGDERKFATRKAIYRTRQCVNPLTLAELRDVTDLWVERVMNLTPADLRRMRHLQFAQARKLQRQSMPR
jgi:DSF synthase